MVNGSNSAHKLLIFGALLVSNEGAALSPVPEPAIPPEIRLTIGVKETTVDNVLNVYRAFEQAATRAELACEPAMKDYESWRAKGFEPMSRNMVCHDSHTALIDASWVNVAPTLITIDFRFRLQAAPSTKPRMERIARELANFLKSDPSVTSLMQDTWLPEHLSSRVK